MRIEDLSRIMNPVAVANAAARIFPQYATWPHSLLVTSMLLERELLAAFVQAEGIVHAPPLDTDIEMLVGISIFFTAFQAVKYELSRSSPTYVQWECVMLLDNLRLTASSEATRNFLRVFPALVRSIGAAAAITPMHYEICRQYRLAFESDAYQLSRTTATRMAILKLVHALEGPAHTEMACDRSLRWALGVERIHKFITASVSQTPIDVLISELEAPGEEDE